MSEVVGIRVWWIKRDLRLQDNAAWVSCVEKSRGEDPVVAIAIIEDSWLKSAEFHPRHLSFFLDSLRALQAELEAKGTQLWVYRGEVLDVLNDLHESLKILSIDAHEEYGLQWSYRRDKSVRRWARSVGVEFQEHRPFGVVRGLKDRDLWAAHRKRLVSRRLLGEVELSDRQRKIPSPQAPSTVPRLEDFGLSAAGFENPPAHRAHAQSVLKGFLKERSVGYLKGISSPLAAEIASSQISPFLTWGQLSIQEVQAHLQDRIDDPTLTPSHRRSLQAFGSRLWWHCHFIQKLESEAAIEFEPFNRAFIGMREPHWNDDYFHAWSHGQTGIPLVDACMRSLLRQGWINFRMRAMLVSFACFPLWLHWKKVAEHLAKCFLDFEPGIHYSQVQMQAGVTGINTIRIYSPTKQSLDHDPQGEFIKRECPELRGLHPPDLFEPWAAPPMVLSAAGICLGQEYPEPIVDVHYALKDSRRRIFEWRKRIDVKQEAKRVFEKHGSRRGSVRGRSSARRSPGGGASP